MSLAAFFQSTATRALLTNTERARLNRLCINDAGHGYDVLGLQPASVAAAVALLRPLYDPLSSARSVQRTRRGHATAVTSDPPS
jgi:hypothetical protein